MIKLFSSYLFLGLIPTALFLIATYLLTHFLTPSEYGIGMLLFSSLQLIAMLCSLGMDQVFLRFFYENDYRERRSCLLYTCLFFIGSCVFIFFIMAVFSAHYFEKQFHINGECIAVLMTIGAIAYILEIFASLMPRIEKKASLYAFGQVVQQTVFLFFVVILLYLWKKKTLIILCSQIIGFLACSAALIYIYRSQWQFPKKYFQQLNLKEIKTLLSYGFPFSFSASLTWIFFNADKFLLLKWSNSVELGVYTAAFVLSSPLEALRATFNLAWTPYCNQLLAEMPFKGKKIFHHTFHQTLWVFTVVASVLLLSKSFLVLFLGQHFRNAEHVFGWLLLSIYFFGLSDIVTAGILKSRKVYWNIIISVASLLTNILLCYFFIPRFGAQGAALANAAGFGLFFLIRYIVGFYYYPFKIFRWKLILYVIYLCSMISLSNKHYFDFQCICTVGFFLISIWFERKWISLYYPFIRASALKFGIKYDIFNKIKI